MPGRAKGEKAKRPKTAKGGKVKRAKTGKGAKAKPAPLGPVEAQLATWAPWQRELGEAIHRAVLAASPSLEARVAEGMPTYVAAARVCYVAAFTKHVVLGFFDREGLEGLEPSVARGGALRFPQGARVDEARVEALVRRALARGPAAPP